MGIGLSNSDSQFSDGFKVSVMEGFPATLTFAGATDNSPKTLYVWYKHNNAVANGGFVSVKGFSMQSQ